MGKWVNPPGHFGPASDMIFSYSGGIYLLSYFSLVITIMYQIGTYTTVKFIFHISVLEF